MLSLILAVMVGQVPPSFSEPPRAAWSLSMSPMDEPKSDSVRASCAKSGCECNPCKCDPCECSADVKRVVPKSSGQKPPTGIKACPLDVNQEAPDSLSDCCDGSPCPCDCGKCCCNSKSKSKGKPVVSTPEQPPTAEIEDLNPIDEPLSRRVLQNHKAKGSAPEQPPYAEVERLLTEVKETLGPRPAPEPRREIQPPVPVVVPQPQYQYQYQPRINMRPAPQMQVPMSYSLPRFRYGTAGCTTSA